jgi:hypothetical protein
MKFKKSWQLNQKSLALSFFGNRTKEFAKGNTLTYIRQRQSSKKLYVIKGIDYLRAKKMTTVKLTPYKG